MIRGDQQATESAQIAAQCWVAPFLLLLGNRTTMVYDAADRGVGAIDPLGNRNTTVFVPSQIPHTLNSAKSALTIWLGTAPSNNASTTRYGFSSRQQQRDPKPHDSPLFPLTNWRFGHGICKMLT